MLINRDKGQGIRNQESGIRDQGSGIRNQESGIRDQDQESAMLTSHSTAHLIPSSFVHFTLNHATIVEQILHFVQNDNGFCRPSPCHLPSNRAKMHCLSANN